MSYDDDGWTGAYGLGVGTLGIGKHENATTEDLSLNVKWNATDQLSFEFDAQQTKADADYTEVWGGGTFYANVFTKPELENPEVTFYVDPRTAFNLGNTRQGGSGQNACAHVNDGSEWRVLAVCGRLLPRRHRRAGCIPHRQQIRFRGRIVVQVGSVWRPLRRARAEQQGNRPELGWHRSGLGRRRRRVLADEHCRRPSSSISRTSSVAASCRERTSSSRSFAATCC